MFSTNGSTAAAYWQQLGIYGSGFYDTYCDAAILLMSSWYDPYPRSVTDNFIGLTHSANALIFFGSRPPYPGLGSRPDVLVFTTVPLAADVEVTGPIEARLCAAASANPGESQSAATWESL